MNSDKFTLRKRKNEWGEYVVRCWRNGKRYPDADYFTQDWDDAVGTHADLVRRAS